MTAAVAGDNFAVACCGRWAADRARFALHCTDAAGRDAGWSFWDVQREANRFSNVLGAAGVMRGDRVALLLPPCAEAAALLVACWQMGATAMPLSPRRSAGELEGAVAEARVVAVGAAGAQALARLAAARPRHAIGIEAAPDAWLRDWAALRPLASTRYAPLGGVADAPALLLDAGTAAARPYSHKELAQAAEPFLAAHPGYPQPGDLFWSAADWSGAAGLLEGLLPAWQLGQPVVAWGGGFAAAAAIELIAKYDVRNARLTAQELEAMMAAVPRPGEKHDCRLRTLAMGGTLPAPALAVWLERELGVRAA